MLFLCLIQPAVCWRNPNNSNWPKRNESKHFGANQQSANQKETKANISVQIRAALQSGKMPFDASCSLTPPSLFYPPLITFNSTNSSDVSITGQFAKVGISNSLSILHFGSHPQGRRVGRIMKRCIFSCSHVSAEKSYLLKVMLNCMIDISFQFQIQFNWDSGNRKN